MGESAPVRNIIVKGENPNLFKKSGELRRVIESLFEISGEFSKSRTSAISTSVYFPSWETESIRRFWRY